MPFSFCVTLLRASSGLGASTATDGAAASSREIAGADTVGSFATPCESTASGAFAGPGAGVAASTGFAGGSTGFAGSGGATGADATGAAAGAGAATGAGATGAAAGAGVAAAAGAVAAAAGASAGF